MSDNHEKSRTGAGPDHETTRDVTEASFEADVIEQSHVRPVVVDFWAPWCGPCRTLGPLIEREVAALGGRVLLAKVNTDENPALAQRFSTMSIPAVKAFRDGRVVDEFVGAQPLGFLRPFLARLAPSESVQRFAAARAAYEKNAPEAEGLLAALVGDAEVGVEAAFRAAHAALDAGHAQAARVHAANVPDTSAFEPRLAALERLIAFAESGGTPDAEPAGDSPAPDENTRIAHAAAFAARGDWRHALEALLESVSRKPRHDDARAKRTMLAIFDHLDEPGRDGDLTREFRRQLQIMS